MDRVYPLWGVGASLIGIGFILPAFELVLFVSRIYIRFNGLAVVQAPFYGIGPVVIAIVFRSAFRLARTTVGSDRKLWFTPGSFAASPNTPK